MARSLSKMRIPWMVPLRQPCIPRMATARIPIRSFGSSHHDNHHHSEPKDPHPEEKTKRLWILTSALIFLPIVYRLTETEKELQDRHGSVSPPDSHVDKSIVEQHQEPAPQESVVVSDAPAIVPHIKYILVGSGTASYSALKAIKEREPEAPILILSEESHLPYQKPPLSKELWSSDSASELMYTDYTGKLRSIFYETVDYFEVVQDFNRLLEPTDKVLFYQAKVKSLDPVANTLETVDGKKIQYSKVLLATGGTPKKLPISLLSSESAKDRILTFRSLFDFEKLTSLLSSGGKTVAIIGGGFLGSELAVALANKGKSNGNQVIQIFPEEGNMALVFPDYLAKWTSQQVAAEGVQVVPKTILNSIELVSDKVHLSLSNNTSVDADYVIMAVGLSPNTELAQVSGLEIDDKRGGIIVNAELEARSNVFAAGDCVSYFDISLGRRRVEHYDHAFASGRQAGLNMTGLKQPYTHQSMFWSDLGPSISYEAVGIIDSRLAMIGNFGPSGQDYRKGIVYYLNDDKRLVGVLLFNFPGKVEEARKLLKLGKTIHHAHDLANVIQ